MEYLLPKDYMALTEEQRRALDQQFNIAKSGNVEVVNNVVVSDGHTASDLTSVNTGAVCEFLGIDVSMETLMPQVLKKLAGKAEQLKADRTAAEEKVKADEAAEISRIDQQTAKATRPGFMQPESNPAPVTPSAVDNAKK